MLFAVSPLVICEIPMRFLVSVVCLGLAAGCLLSRSACAGEPPFEAARWRARHELALAKMELRNYWQVEYPRQQRYLNAEIVLTEAEIRSYKERLLEYEPFNRFSRGQPFATTLQDVQMCLLEAELRLRDLWAERNALLRSHSDTWRALEHKVHAARLRVAEIEAAGKAPPDVDDNSA
jgi:hypothetical protein